ncbi:hypothetical protein DEM34_10700 [Spiribacter halobius]|uniref:Uncharacterized protein n=1 Tax=Sediminicurvatus halobius TaxID=2182432 RepID=A0A2U2N191_9GAMM|nr:hypothetical protein DEM34_10700 [Spiribacter halobius]
MQPYCPLPSRQLLARRLANGKYIFGPDGLEKRCCGCEEYWPADTEFWFAVPSAADGLQSMCKACYAERYSARREVA